MNKEFEIMFETGVDEMSWDDTVSSNKITAKSQQCVQCSTLGKKHGPGTASTDCQWCSSSSFESQKGRGLPIVQVIR